VGVQVEELFFEELQDVPDSVPTIWFVNTDSAAVLVDFTDGSCVGGIRGFG
jgi:hypothetical protein